MDCGKYYGENKRTITLFKGDKWKREIEYIVKAYSSCMMSYVLFCYPCGDKNEKEQVKKCINLYSDYESVLDSILNEAITTGCVNLDKYYDNEIFDAD